MKILLKSLSWILLIPFLHIVTTLLWPDFIQVAFPHLLLMYGILCVMTTIHLFVVRVVVRRHQEQAAMIVMALNMLKMLLSIVLLFVIVVPLTGKGGAVALNFGVAYLFFLIFDSQLVLLMMRGDN